jgi:hypothetical protein
MLLKEVRISDDLVAINKFKPEWIILKNTKLKVWELVNIWWINFTINEIFFRIMWILDITTEENWFYTFVHPNENNYQAYEFYEKNWTI